jgi:hypothetical protein
MAIIHSNGLITGTVGNKVFYVLKGKQVIRTKRREPSKPTTRQQASNEKLKVISKFLCMLKEAMRQGWADPEDSSAYYNSALSYNYKNAVTEIPGKEGERPDFKINLPEVLLSKGRIEHPEINKIERKDNNLYLEWDTTLGSKTNRPNDSLTVCIWNETGPAIVHYGMGFRQTGKAVIKLEGEPDSLHVWAYFHNITRFGNDNEARVSKSVYLGKW